MFTMPPVFNAGDTIYFPFDTYDSNGASVTITGLATTDIEVYKNGSVTQRASDNGYALLDTDGIDFDSTTGLHGFSIDTSDNSDSGFWADGAQYWVNVNAITVDSQTVRFTYLLPLGYLLRPTTAGRKLDVSSGGEAGLDWANIGSPTTTVNLSGTTVKDATDVNTDTDTLLSRMGTPSDLGGGATVAANLSDIEAQTDDIGAAGAGLTALATAAELAKVPKSDSNVTWNATAAAQIQSEAADALNAYDPPTREEMKHFFQVLMRSDAAIFTDLFSIISEINEDHGSGEGDYDSRADAVEAIRDRGDSAWVTATGFSTFNPSSDKVQLHATQPDYAPSKAGDLMGLANDAITAAKFDESTAFPITSADTGSTRVARTGADSDTLETLSDQVDGTATPSQVNAEVVDALATDTYAEPGQGTPAATLSLAAKINYLFKSWRNKKTQTSGVWSLFNDDTSTVDQKATVSDDGTTATKGEIATGP